MTWPDVAPLGNGTGQISGLPKMEQSSCRALETERAAQLSLQVPRNRGVEHPNVNARTDAKSKGCRANFPNGSSIDIHDPKYVHCTRLKKEPGLL